MRKLLNGSDLNDIIFTSDNLKEINSIYNKEQKEIMRRLILLSNKYNFKYPNPDNPKELLPIEVIGVINEETGELRFRCNEHILTEFILNLYL